MSDNQPATDLPKGIGKVATRELSLAGLTSLDDLTTVAEAELLAIHGVGPKAVRILREELAARDLSFRSESTTRS